MIATTRSSPDQVTLSRAVSGHAYQTVTATRTDDGVVVRVESRLSGREGDGWAEAHLDADKLAALRDWIAEHAMEP
jgi:hypothetical protein